MHCIVLSYPILNKQSAQDHLYKKSYGGESKKPSKMSMDIKVSIANKTLLDCMNTT